MAATAAAPAATAADLRPIVSRHDAAVERLLARQVTDTTSRWCGTYPDDDGLHNPHPAGGILDAFTAAFLHPESKFHKSPLLMHRMDLAGKHLLSRQNAEGNIDLVVTNFNSPPDTAFVVHNVGTAACLARRNKVAEISRLTDPFLKRAGESLIRGGVHTPNHRWVVCYALAQINELFPDPRYVRRIDQWLSEGIDIDADGQYAERSTLIYNVITNRSLIVVAHKLRRPELLDPVRRNLESMLYLMHPGDELVTEVSRRQDLNQAGNIGRYWFALQYMAVRDKDARFSALARQYAAENASLSAMMEYPEELAVLGPEPGAIPDDYEKQFRAIRVARIRRGLTSATLILGGSSRFLTLRRGEAVINGLRFATGFFGKAQFIPELAEKRGNSYRLTQTLTADYSQPLEPPRRITGEEYYTTRNSRRRTEICKLEQSAIVTENRNGFTVRIQAHGTADVPLAVEVNLREGGNLDGAMKHPRVANAWLLPSGSAAYRVGRDSIRIGPGAGPHSYVEVRGAEPKLSGPSIYITGYTPFDHTLTFDWE
jgi:hypothetical protein